MALPKKYDFNDYDNYLTDPNPTTSAEAQDYFRNTDSLVGALIDAFLWQPETNYANGDVVKSDSMPNGTEAVCVSTNGGISSIVVPQWGNVGGENIADGTCFWKLRWEHWSKDVEAIKKEVTDKTDELADYPLRNKAYSLNAIVACPYHAEFMLKCTQAGTTSAEALDTTLVKLGQIIEDGNAEWTVYPLCDFLNVKMFMAKGNGVNDDTEAFRQAVAVAQKLKISLFVPKGNYVLNTFGYEEFSSSDIRRKAAVIVGDNVNIFGEHGSVIVAGQTTTNNDCLMLAYGNNISVKNLQFKGNGLVGGPTGGIRLLDCQGEYINVSNIECLYNGYAGVRAYNCKNFSIDNLTGRGVEVLFESLGEYGDNFKVSNIRTYAYYDETYSNIAGEAIALFATSNNHWNIDNVYSYGKTSAAALLIGNNGSVEREIIANNIFATNIYLEEGTANYCVVVGTSNNVTIENCANYAVGAFGVANVFDSNNVKISAVDYGANGTNLNGDCSPTLRIKGTTNINVALTCEIATRANKTPIVLTDEKCSGEVYLNGNIPTNQYATIFGKVLISSRTCQRLNSISSGGDSRISAPCSNASGVNGYIVERFGEYNNLEIPSYITKNSAAIMHFVVDNAEAIQGLNNLQPIRTPSFTIFIRGGVTQDIVFTPVESETVKWSDTANIVVNAATTVALMISSNGYVVEITKL